jgi:GNAT superfamily N-acetyltransferase
MNTKSDILEIAKAQLALDYNYQLSDLEKKENIISENRLIKGRRIYNSDGCFFKAVCFGSKAMISASPQILPWCQEKLADRDGEWFFEYPKLRAIDIKLNEFGHEIADLHHYYLPDPSVQEIKLINDTKWYEYEDIKQFKDDDRFGEAFAFDKNHPDVLAVAALEGNEIIGMAGASADGETMWQIGIDVLPAYRSRGIGTNLISLLKSEILKRGKVPFYGTVVSHIHSQNIAINAGFFPAWAELYSRKMK